MIKMVSFYMYLTTTKNFVNKNYNNIKAWRISDVLGKVREAC